MCNKKPNKIRSQTRPIYFLAITSPSSPSTPARLVLQVVDCLGNEDQLQSERDGAGRLNLCFMGTLGVMVVSGVWSALAQPLSGPTLPSGCRAGSPGLLPASPCLLSLLNYLLLFWKHKNHMDVLVSENYFHSFIISFGFNKYCSNRE